MQGRRTRSAGHVQRWLNRAKLVESCSWSVEAVWLHTRCAWGARTMCAVWAHLADGFWRCESKRLSVSRLSHACYPCAQVTLGLKGVVYATPHTVLATTWSALQFATMQGFVHARPMQNTDRLQAEGTRSLLPVYT
eukprot:356496-Chlamydomonas_euryale.AAC.5